MDDKKIEEYEERLKNRHVERNYNFFKPVGQFIEHVDTINFSMDKDGTFHFENIGQVNGPESQNLTKGTVPVVREQEQSVEEEEQEEVPLTAADMAAACEQTLAEGYCWADASWGTAYQIFLQKGYNGGIEQFVRDVENWPFKKVFVKKCNKYSVGNPARKGKITWPFEKWREKGVAERQIKFGKRLLEILKGKGKKVKMDIDTIN